MKYKIIIYPDGGVEAQDPSGRAVSKSMPWLIKALGEIGEEKHLSGSHTHTEKESIEIQNG
ncbi:hypothetical protein HYS94_02080 [Candidatus Daviesbacteria bacterium]|nr:hypothetical protein [Candidatus Daviesbacteria bacterium]